MAEAFDLAIFLMAKNNGGTKSMELSVAKHLLEAIETKITQFRGSL